LVAPLRHLPNIRAVDSTKRWEPIPCRGPIRGLTPPARQAARNCRAEQYWDKLGGGDRETTPLS